MLGGGTSKQLEAEYGTISEAKKGRIDKINRFIRRHLYVDKFFQRSV